MNPCPICLRNQVLASAKPTSHPARVQTPKAWLLNHPHTHGKPWAPRATYRGREGKGSLFTLVFPFEVQGDAPSISLLGKIRQSGLQACSRLPVKWDTLCWALAVSCTEQLGKPFCDNPHQVKHSPSVIRLSPCSCQKWVTAPWVSAKSGLPFAALLLKPEKIIHFVQDKKQRQNEELSFKTCSPAQWLGTHQPEREPGHGGASEDVICSYPA